MKMIDRAHLIQVVAKVLRVQYLSEYESKDPISAWFAQAAEIVDAIIEALTERDDPVREAAQVLHAAFADPLRGGADGYQAACWDCDWRGTVQGPSGEGKDLAKDEAKAHRAALAGERER